MSAWSPRWVHPSESLAAYFPWLAREWHPTKNELRPDQVSRASAREVVWRSSWAMSGRRSPTLGRFHGAVARRAIAATSQSGSEPARGAPA